MIIVSNTSPLINLALVGHLNLLKKLYKKVLIPQAVYDEIVIDGAGQPGAKEVEEYDWIQVRSIRNTHLVEVLKQDLDRGEAEAIERLSLTSVLMRIVNGKIWLEEENTMYQFVEELLDRGIRKSEIVLASKPESLRPYTDFAVA
ncbi:MAG: element excision factor XisI family protein [Chloroflexota bacterium]